MSRFGLQGGGKTQSDGRTCQIVVIVGRMNAPETSELERRRWYALLVVSIGTFMTPFDASIVSVALPSLGKDLHLSYSQGLWAQAAYLLLATILLIPAGRMADSRGPARYYLVGTAVFALGSIMAVLSPGGSVLILARCVQGSRRRNAAGPWD
jgi:predicted MFS family arabinose efflux permease